MSLGFLGFLFSSLVAPSARSLVWGFSSSFPNQIGYLIMGGNVVGNVRDKFHDLIKGA